MNVSKSPTSSSTARKSGTSRTAGIATRKSGKLPVSNVVSETISVSVVHISHIANRSSADLEKYYKIPKVREVSDVSSDRCPGDQSVLLSSEHDNPAAKLLVSARMSAPVSLDIGNISVDQGPSPTEMDSRYLASERNNDPHGFITRHTMAAF